jgi:hypothetical protein
MYKYRVHHSTIAYLWKDTKEVMLLSNCHGNNRIAISRKGKDGSKMRTTKVRKENQKLYALLVMLRCATCTLHHIIHEINIIFILFMYFFNKYSQIIFEKHR